MTHDLKTWPDSFKAILDGVKRYEVRKADRDFKVRDTLCLQEWFPETATYSGRRILALVTYMSEPGSFGLPSDLCVMSIEPREYTLAV